MNMKAIKKMPEEKPAAVNPCRLCAPLGAVLATKGFDGAFPLLHGSQGCATYIRRYMISHFREPVDIASSSFSEETAIFGGGANLAEAIKNITSKYNPKIICVATTCISETIGEDVPGMLREIQSKTGCGPKIVFVSTPSYSKDHSAGFEATVSAFIDKFSIPGLKSHHVNIFPGMISPADIRHLREITQSFNIDASFFPDYSNTLDGEVWGKYVPMPGGATDLKEVIRAGSACASIELTTDNSNMRKTPGRLLKEKFGVPLFSTGMPIGITGCDNFFKVLEEISGQKRSKKYEAERGRLIDSYVDCHKYFFQKRTAVYGDPELTTGFCSFASEIGLTVTLAATGSAKGSLTQMISNCIPKDQKSPEMVLEDTDFENIGETAGKSGTEIAIGNSKGYRSAREHGIKLIRAGFPIHDRVGGQRLLHVGYQGTQEFFDRIVNTLLEIKQESSAVGYSYM